MPYLSLRNGPLCLARAGKYGVVGLMATKSVTVRFFLYTRDTTGVADEACYQTATQALASVNEYRKKWPGRTAVMAMQTTSVYHLVVDDDALQRMAERELFDTSVMDDDDDD